MADFLLKNKDNTLLRSIIVALLGELTKRVYYFNHDGDENYKKIYVPIYMQNTGQELIYAQDYMNYADDTNRCFTNGDVKEVPRGVLAINGFSVNPGEQTNKYTHIQFERESRKSGIIYTIVAKGVFVPISMDFTFTILCSNHLELLKISEAIIAKIYTRNNIFNINYGSMRVEATFTIPESFSSTIPVDYNFDTQKEYKMDLSLNLKTLLPVIHPGVTMDEIDYLLYNMNEEGRDNVNSYPAVLEVARDSYGELCLNKAGIFLGDTSTPEKENAIYNDLYMDGENVAHTEIKNNYGDPYNRDVNGLYFKK